MILSRSRAVRPRRGLVGGGGHRGTRVTDSSAAGAGRVFRNSIPPSKQTSEQPARKHRVALHMFGYFYSVGRQGACSGWLKEVAAANIPPIPLTLDTFHLLSGWLKDLASKNISAISVTLDTSQLLSGWLKEGAL